MHLTTRWKWAERLPLRRLDHTHHIQVRVSKDSTIRVRKNSYSVDSRLIGEQVRVHLDTEGLEVWYGGECVEQILAKCGGRVGKIDAETIGEVELARSCWVMLG